jgi:tRNA G46 methylase TrmB
MLENNHNNQGFDPQVFAKLYEWEKGNFWFQSRNDRILFLMKRFLSEPQKFLEIGCGTGFVLEAIHGQYPNSKVIGSELFQEGLDYAKKRNPNLELK